MNSNVTVIPASESKPGILRVAAYCRVSTDSEEQINSYKNQLAYYTEKINSKTEWKFAGIYADDTAILGLKSELQ